MGNPQNLLTAALCFTLFALSYNSAIYSSLGDRLGYGVPTAFHPVAVFVGALASWPLSLKLGRKPLILGAISVMVIGAAFSISGGPYGLQIAGYMLDGLAAGVSYVTAVVWQVEVSRAGDRGRRLIIIHMGALGGSAFALWMEFAFSSTFIYTTFSRTTMGLEFAFLVPAAAMVYFSTDSWRHLLLREQPDRARAVLEHVNPHLAGSFDILLIHSRQPARTLLSCCRSRNKGFTHSLRPYRRLLLASLLQILQLWAGFSTAATYLITSVYALSSNSRKTSAAIYAMQAALPTMELVFSLIPFFFIDRPIRFLGGRRNLLIVSVLGMAICFIPPTIAASVSKPYSADSYYYTLYVQGSTGKIYFAFFFISTFFYALGLGPIPALYAAEIAPSNCRLAVFAVSSALSRAFGIMYQWLATSMTYGVGYYLFIIWLVIDIIIAGMVWLMYPETAGKGLESMDLAFARGMGVLMVRERGLRMVEQNFESEQLRNASDFGGAAELDERRDVVEGEPHLQRKQYGNGAEVEL